ncbi:hypothetical protein [Actinocorallia sp. A-T 12471]|uniref:hypothetical protein n=1 Tax=Actinocorallia sp. A-T 12471 TaxID=3089813 RepID=UPI0029CD8935|nr:hypothetical protein [Actinocorallia sp. A-T 12471]MDX6738147.1 hypothetical protein [Actinocorallia sp. A-T 12471]
MVARLLLWVRKGALRARGRETRHVMRREGLEVLDEVAANGEGAIGQEPVRVLVEAVRVGVISARAAELINATRLERQSLQDFAKSAGVPADRLYKQRKTAEARLARAIEEGQVLVSKVGLLSDSGS